ncbi:hypothetical protein [Aquimarina litoralis]|uniref:hypothetical protein n=1 Tax=Aquimarina litoralis TaxID=584605 RepID=UPI001C59B8A5|nr:hypothetical protein [Aquimarina litoralis]MBW1294113.1 hypothetical protein [Aquimarina litoralis]
MKNNILIVIITLITNTIIVAQQKMDVNEMADYQTQKMIQELDLNNEQIEKVEAINLKYTSEMVVLIEADGSMFGKIGDMKEIKKQKLSELEKVLTTEQLEKFEEDVAPDIRDHMKKNMKM